LDFGPALSSFLVLTRDGLLRQDQIADEYTAVAHYEEVPPVLGQLPEALRLVLLFPLLRDRQSHQVQVGTRALAMNHFQHTRLAAAQHDVDLGFDADLRNQLEQKQLGSLAHLLAGGDTEDADACIAPFRVAGQQAGEEQDQVAVALQAAPPDVDFPLFAFPRGRNFVDVVDQQRLVEPPLFPVPQAFSISQGEPR